MNIIKINVINMALTKEDKETIRKLIQESKIKGLDKKATIERIINNYGYKASTVSKYWEALK